MKVRHLYSLDGYALTEALYEREGVPHCSRFLGHLAANEVSSLLELYRRMDANPPRR